MKKQKDDAKIDERVKRNEMLRSYQSLSVWSQFSLNYSTVSDSPMISKAVELYGEYFMKKKL